MGSRRVGGRFPDTAKQRCPRRGAHAERNEYGVSGKPIDMVRAVLRSRRRFGLDYNTFFGPSE